MIYYQCPLCGASLDTYGNCPNGCKWFEGNLTWQIPTAYNYKCPGCNGEFNQPNFIPAPGSCNVGTYKCPFCGYEMIGLENYKY
jgi:hypothetical protein